MSSVNKLNGHFIDSVTNIANTFQSTSAVVSDNLTNTISSNVSGIIGLNGFSFKTFLQLMWPLQYVIFLLLPLPLLTVSMAKC